MGVNVWLKINVCDKCGREDDKIHVGKTSWERKFMFAATDSLKNKCDWINFLAARLEDKDNKLVDDEDNIIPLDEFINEIEHSAIYKGHEHDFDSTPAWRDENFYSEGGCDFMKGDWS